MGTSLGIGLGISITGQGGSGGGPPPATDVILQENGDDLLLEAGTSVLKNTSIPAQAAAGTLAGTEWVAIVQGGVTKKIALNTLMTYARTN